MSEGALWSIRFWRRPVNALFASDDDGKLFQRAVNQEFNNVHSSEVSEHWIRLNWLPGVIPRPAVVNGQLPVITRPGPESVLSVIRVDWGRKAGAPRTSAFLLIHSAHCRASQRTWRRFRKGRSASEPRRSRSAPGAVGKTSRQQATFSKRLRTSAKAKSEKAGEATSTLDSVPSTSRSASTTRSLPLFLISFIGIKCHGVTACVWWRSSFDLPVIDTSNNLTANSVELPLNKHVYRTCRDCSV